MAWALQILRGNLEDMVHQREGVDVVDWVDLIKVLTNIKLALVPYEIFTSAVEGIDILGHNQLILTIDTVDGGYSADAIVKVYDSIQHDHDMEYI